MQSEARKQFLQAASQDDYFHFAVSSDEGVRKEYGITGEAAVVLLKNYDSHSRIEFHGDMTADAINKFVIAQAQPLVMEFDQENRKLQIYLNLVTNSLLIYAGSNSSNLSTLVSEARVAAKNFKGKVSHTLIKLDKWHNMQINFVCRLSFRFFSSQSTRTKRRTSICSTSSS